MNIDDEMANQIQDLVDSHLSGLSDALDRLVVGSEGRVTNPEVQAALLKALLRWVVYIEAGGGDPSNRPQPKEPIRSRTESDRS